MNFIMDSLQTGSKVLGDLISSGRDAFNLGANIGDRIGSGEFFGEQTQRIKLTSSVVSNSPYEGPGISNVGSTPRPKSSEALTLSDTYKAWWKAKDSLGAKIWNQVKGTYMGIKLNQLSKGVLNNLGQTTNTVINTGLNTVTDIITNSLNMGIRPADGNHEQDNNQPGGIKRELSYNKITAGNPGTESVVSNFMEAIYNPDKQGSFNIAFPSSAMNSSLNTDVPNNNSDVEPLPLGIPMNTLLLGALIIGGILVVRKRGK